MFEINAASFSQGQTENENGVRGREASTTWNFKKQAEKTLSIHSPKPYTVKACKCSIPTYVTAQKKASHSQRYQASICRDMSFLAQLYLTKRKF